MNTIIFNKLNWHNGHAKTNKVQNKFTCLITESLFSSITIRQTRGIIHASRKHDLSRKAVRGINNDQSPSSEQIHTTATPKPHAEGISGWFLQEANWYTSSSVHHFTRLNKTYTTKGFFIWYGSTCTLKKKLSTPTFAQSLVLHKACCKLAGVQSPNGLVLHGR